MGAVSEDGVPSALAELLAKVAELRERKAEAATE